MLVAGASANSPSALGGALTFHVNDLPSGTGLVYGSAFIYIMLIAGAGASSSSAICGAFSFHIITLPSDDTWWYAGSAY